MSESANTIETLAETLNGRTSLESEGQIPEDFKGTNGHTRQDSNLAEHLDKLEVNGRDVNGDQDPLERLQRELDKAREEKETLAEQYQNLLSRLTTMRNTLGSKLREDAEELDRREQLLQQYITQNEDLITTVETLKSELISSNQDADRFSHELSIIRSKASEENAMEASLREREVQELQLELERCRAERDEWENLTQEERMSGDEARTLVQSLRRELELERDERQKRELELQREKEMSANLQSVLEDFQSGKERESQQIAAEHEIQMQQTAQSLAEFKQRALDAEEQLSKLTFDGERCAQLEKELKEKNSLIGKVRHDAVILNQHLTEALRRLRKSSSEFNVDRRLVTNVLLTFLATPRGDSKRFEMLSVIASVLSWDDGEREKAGLQRIGATGASTSNSLQATSSSIGKSPIDLAKGDETESFSRLWVEFLLKESAQGSAINSGPLLSRAQSSLPASPPVSGLWSPSHRSPAAVTPRLPSVSSHSERSTPNLTLPPPPRKRDG